MNEDLWKAFYANHLHTALQLTQLAAQNEKEKSPIEIFEDYMDQLKRISKK